MSTADKKCPFEHALICLCLSPSFCLLVCWRICFDHEYPRAGLKICVTCHGSVCVCLCTCVLELVYLVSVCTCICVRVPVSIRACVRVLACGWRCVRSQTASNTVNQMEQKDSEWEPSCSPFLLEEWSEIQQKVRCYLWLTVIEKTVSLSFLLLIDFPS